MNNISVGKIPLFQILASTTDSLNRSFTKTCDESIYHSLAI